MPMMGYGFGGFGIILVIVYLGAVLYFFVLLSRIAKSLQRIADRFEQIKTEEK